MPSDIWTSTVSSNLDRLTCLSRAMACLSGGVPALAIFWWSFLILLRSFLPRRGGCPGCWPFFLTDPAGAVAVAAAGAATAEGATGGAGSPAAAGAASALGALALGARGFFASAPAGFSSAAAAGLSLASSGLSACFLAMIVWKVLFLKIPFRLAASRRRERWDRRLAGLALACGSRLIGNGLYIYF